MLSHLSSATVSQKAELEVPKELIDQCGDGKGCSVAKTEKIEPALIGDRHQVQFIGEAGLGEVDTIRVGEAPGAQSLLDAIIKQSRALTKSSMAWPGPP